MSVDIGRSLREGAARTFGHNGVLLIVVWSVLGALSLLAYNGLFASMTSGLPAEPMLVGPTLDVSPAVAGVVGLLSYLASLVVMAGAVRTFVTDERRALPTRHFTRNLGWTLLNLVVGYVLFVVAVWIGFLLLVVPGLFLLVSLYFWFVVVAVEDRDFWTAFRESWDLTRGNRWSLLGLGVVVTVVGWVLMAVPMALAFLLPAWVALVVYGLAVSVYGVFGIATTARAYVQLTGSAL